MTFEFDIAGQTCVADEVRMQGRGMIAQFGADALGAVSAALASQTLVGLTGMAASPLYEVQKIEDHGAAGCDVVLEIASSKGRMLH